MMEVLRVEDDDTEVSVYLQIRSIGLILKSLNVMLDLTGDPELLSIYEALYEQYEQYGVVVDVESEDEDDG